MTEAYYLFAVTLKSFFYLALLVLLSVWVSAFRRKVIRFFCGRSAQKPTANRFKPLAVFIKTLFQKNCTWSKNNNLIDRLMPAFSALSALLVFVVIPFGDRYLNLSDLHPGLARFQLYVLAELENGTIFLFLAILLAGVTSFLSFWSVSEQNTCFNLGWEIAKIFISNLNLILIILGLLVFTRSLNLFDFVYYQEAHGWFVLRQPLAFFLFYIVFYSSTNLLVSNQSGKLLQNHSPVANKLGAAACLLLKFAQNLRLLAAASLITLFFLGGWLAPFSGWPGWDFFADLPGLVFFWPLIWFFLKTFAVLLIFIWLALTFPAAGNKQTISINYKLLLPFAAGNLFLNAIIKSGENPLYSEFFLQIGFLVLFFLFMNKQLSGGYRFLVPRFILPRGKGREHD